MLTQSEFLFRRGDLSAQEEVETTYPRGCEQRSPSPQAHRLVRSLKDRNHTVPKVFKRLLGGSSLTTLVTHGEAERSLLARIDRWMATMALPSVTRPVVQAVWRA